MNDLKKACLKYNRYIMTNHDFSVFLFTFRDLNILRALWRISNVVYLHWLAFERNFFSVSDREQQTCTPPMQQDHHGEHHPPPSSSSGFILPELPEPPIPLSEIGPIPPPPMFSSPSPMPRRQVTTPPIINQHIEYDYEGQYTKIVIIKRVLMYSYWKIFQKEWLFFGLRFLVF